MKSFFEKALVDLLGLGVGDVGLEVERRVGHLNQQRT